MLYFGNWYSSSVAAKSSNAEAMTAWYAGATAMGAKRDENSARSVAMSIWLLTAELLPYWMM